MKFQIATSFRLVTTNFVRQFRPFSFHGLSAAYGKSGLVEWKLFFLGFLGESMNNVAKGSRRLTVTPIFPLMRHNAIIEKALVVNMFPRFQSGTFF
jgi:hypothetical protein